jgi:hypothetical protein
LEELEARVESVEPNPFEDTTPHTTDQVSRTEHENLCSLIDDLRMTQMEQPVGLPPGVLDRITTLEEDCSTMEQKLGDTASYTFEGLTFGCEDDILKLLGSGLDEVHSGLFLDLVGTTSRLEDDFSSGKEYADKTRSARTVGITPLEADQMSTMPNTTVLFLFEKNAGKKIAVEEDDGWGYRMESFDRYTGAKGKAVRTDLTTRVKNLTTTVKGSIVGQGPGQRLARHLLTEVVRQVSELTNFLTDYQSELENECNYPSKVAWRYLGITTRSIFNFLIPPRMEVAAVGDLGSRPSRARIIWAVLQVHIRMNALADCAFKSHPVLTTTMSSFIMKNRIDSSQLDAVIAKCDLISKSTGASDKRVGVLETNAKATAINIMTIKAKIK